LTKLLLWAGAILLAIFLLQKINLLPQFKDWFKSKPLVIENTAIIVTEIKNIA
jgi:hypothetical protein